MSDESCFDNIVEKLLDTGFSCTCCAECCKEVSEGSNLVIVSPKEIRSIMQATGLEWGEVAEPYPDQIHEGNKVYSFEWVLRREDGRCRFLKNNLCTVYASRPLICRTYPFMLDRGKFLAFQCKGTGKKISREEAGIIARELIERQHEEEIEEMKVMKHFQAAEIPDKVPVVFDGEGMKIIHG